MKRIIDLSGATSDEVFRLRLDKGCVLIAHGTEESPNEVRVPAPEIAVLVVGHRLAMTGAVLGAVAASGGSVLVLDDRYRPAGLMLPMEGNRAHAERLRKQVERLPALAPALWQQVVRAKIREQADLVPEARLREFVDRVEPADPQNIEATAARIYWRCLFGDAFRRHADDNTNRALNYGYAVLRAMVARAVCAAGLHPALGLHHHGWRDTFALADDLMEPARPLVDAVVVEAAGRPLEASVKRGLAGVVLTEVRTTRGTCKLMEAYEATCQSLVASLNSGAPLELWDPAGTE